MKRLAAWSLLTVALCFFTPEAGRLWVSIGAVFFSSMVVMRVEGLV